MYTTSSLCYVHVDSLVFGISRSPTDMSFFCD